MVNNTSNLWNDSQNIKNLAATELVQKIKIRFAKSNLNLNEADFDYLTKVHQDLVNDHSIKNLSKIISQLPQDRTDLAQVITTMLYQDALKQTNSDQLQMEQKVATTGAEIADTISESVDSKTHKDLLDIDYLRKNHPAFIKLELNAWEWDYLDKVKWSFIEDASMYNLKKTIGELTDSVSYLAQPIIFLYNQADKLKHEVLDIRILAKYNHYLKTKKFTEEELNLLQWTIDHFKQSEDSFENLMQTVNSLPQDKKHLVSSVGYLFYKVMFSFY